VTALCGARVSVDVPRCNAPASPASDPDVPLCERHLRMRDDVERRWGHKPSSRAYYPTPAEIAAVLNDGGRRT